MKKALVYVNIGTPEDLSVKAVKRYLSYFLMDPYVIDIPYLFRLLLVRGIIVPFRAKKSLEAYKEVWTDEGSPLDVYTKQLVESTDLGDDWVVEYAMSYSAPFINDVLDKVKKEGAKEIYILPMYPQYALSTTKSTMEAAKKWNLKNSDIVLKTRDFFFDDLDFLKASENKIKKQTQTLSDDYYHLFSFHGLPFRHVKKLHPNHCNNNESCCDVLSEKNQFCYRAQCHHTAKILSKRLGFKKWGYSFQSRLGKDTWLLPYSVKKVEELAKNGEKKISVIPYAFTIDCLETEEEVENEIKDIFVSHGGESLHRIECLNKDFSDVLTKEFLGQFKQL